LFFIYVLYVVPYAQKQKLCKYLYYSVLFLIRALNDTDFQTFNKTFRSFNEFNRLNRHFLKGRREEYPINFDGTTIIRIVESSY